MELRLYSFVTYYLSSIQQGIQTGHVAVDLVRKYTANGNPLRTDITANQVKLVEEWADCHKTFITLNGGNAAGISEATRIISQAGTYPWAIFKEDEASLGGIQTCVAVVLPEKIFAARPNREAGKIVNYEYLNEDTGWMQIYWPDHPHFELVKLVTSAPLAR